MIKLHVPNKWASRSESYFLSLGGRLHVAGTEHRRRLKTRDLQIRRSKCVVTSSAQSRSNGCLLAGIGKDSCAMTTSSRLDWIGPQSASMNGGSWGFRTLRNESGDVLLGSCSDPQGGTSPAGTTAQKAKHKRDQSAIVGTAGGSHRVPWVEASAGLCPQVLQRAPVGKQPRCATECRCVEKAGGRQAGPKMATSNNQLQSVKSSRPGDA